MRRIQQPWTLFMRRKKMCFLKFVSLFWKKYYRCRVLKTYFFPFVREEISKMMKMKILMPFLRKSPYLSDCQANRLFYNIASLTTQNVSSRSRAREPRIYYTTYILYTYMYIYMVLVLYIGFSACLHELDSRPIFFFVLGNDYTIEPLP